MKATGIIRRVDELGRVVIPKEIRRTMRIRQGDPLEIYTDNKNELIFKKYSPIEDLAEIAAQFADAAYKACRLTIIIIDKDIVVACAGVAKTDVIGQIISSEIKEVIDSRQLYTWRSDNKKTPVLDRQDKYFAKTVMPIFSEGDVIGAVATIEVDTLLSEPTESEIKITKTAAVFLGKQLDC